MNLDERRLEELIGQSQDIQSDAMRGSKEPLREIVELGQERRAAKHYEVDLDETRHFDQSRRILIRRTIFAAGSFAAGGFGASLLARMATPVWADQSLDIQILQTAASLENLAVATYGLALTLPFISGGNAVVKKFAETTMGQHKEHGQAFNAAVKGLGAKEQTNVDPAANKIVEDAKPNIKGPADVVNLAATLETAATHTYVANVNALTDGAARKITASIMGVEAQHLATLLAVKALLAGGAANLIALPTNVAALPAAAGSVAFPNSFMPTDAKRDPAEGAVK